MAPFRVLVVDDEPAICELVETLLGGADVAVQSAYSGPEAVSVAARRPPDLILLDVVLPGLDGIATCRLLRSRPELQHVPIYMLTARSSAEDHEESMRAGASGHIEKPFRGTELIELVRRLRTVRGVD